MKTIDDAIDIQKALLAADVSRRIKAEGLALPDRFRIEPCGSGALNIHTGCRHADEYSIRQVDDAWQRDAPGDVRFTTLDAIHEIAHLAIRLSVQMHDVEHMPSWAVLIHPVLLAALLTHEPDRRRMPVRGRSSEKVPGGRWDLDADGKVSHDGRIGTATGDAWLSKGIMQASFVGILMPMGDKIASVTVSSIPTVGNPGIGNTSITLPGVLPETAVTTIIGRRFGDVIALHQSGHEDVDKAAADCLITGHEETANGFTLKMAPARLIPYGNAPTAEIARAMALAPFTG